MGHAILYLTLQLMVFNYLYIISLYSLKWQVQMFKLHLELNQKDSMEKQILPCCVGL